MTIEESGSLLHWNYFLALEADLERLARFVEFTNENFGTYSIEIARLLQSACSEVDVLAHKLCKHLDSGTRARNIGPYRPLLRRGIPSLEVTVVQVPRYGLTLTPWTNWQSDRTPGWWSDHNKVKHRRSDYFPLANLENVLNASAGLLLLTVCFYRLTANVFSIEPAPSLLKPDELFAPIVIIAGGPALRVSAVP